MKASLAEGLHDRTPEAKMVLKFFLNAKSENLKTVNFCSFHCYLITNKIRELESAESNRIMENVSSSFSVDFWFTFYLCQTLSLCH